MQFESDMSRALDGRVVVVTGASSGIGRAISAALVDAGAEVAMLARRFEPLAEAAHAVGGRAFPCDVTDSESIESVSERIEKFIGPVDIIVNNAGIFGPQPVVDISVSEFAKSISTNLVAPFAIVERFLPGMLKRGYGHLISIGSSADRNVFTNNGSYGPAKHGLRVLHETLRAELQGSGVRVTTISPSGTDTPIWDPIDLDANYGKYPPRSLMLRPEDVAQAVRWALQQPMSINIDEIRLSHA
jgi:NADP-dependent 3-hydroxy acid dehydrogenase YdfG